MPYTFNSPRRARTTTTETAAQRIARLDEQHRALCEARAAGTLPQAVIDEVELLDPDFMWDRAAADSALAASTGIAVAVLGDDSEYEAPTGAFLRADLISDRALMLAFLEASPAGFSAALHDHFEAVAAAPVAAISADDEYLVSLWMLVRARELLAARVLN